MTTDMQQDINTLGHCHKPKTKKLPLLKRVKAFFKTYGFCFLISFTVAFVSSYIWVYIFNM